MQRDGNFEETGVIMQRFFLRKFPVVAGALFCLSSCNPPADHSSGAVPSAIDMMQIIKAAPEKIKVSSVAFASGAALALQQAHSDCGGQNVSPPLSWQGVPANAKSVAIVVSDPNAPGGAWTHWIIYNLPPGRKDIGAGIAVGEVVPGGAAQAKNDWGVAGYGGPCPPSGQHNYEFHVLALDKNLTLPGADKSEFAKAISGHILARGVLTGTYNKTK